MATLTVEIRPQNAKGLYPVTFLVCAGKSKKRIPTVLYLTDTDLSANKKKIKNIQKARALEMMRRELEDRLFLLAPELIGLQNSAAYIVERLLLKAKQLDFFEFADAWLKQTTIRSKKNYVCMLNSLERYNRGRTLAFRDINYAFLSGYERFLAGHSTAQNSYLGAIRHLYREAMRQYNTDEDLVIRNDPFTRYRVPKRKMLKGVRALTLEQFLAIYNYEARPGSRAMLARDVFVLSFCLMGMNSVDLYECRTLRDGKLCYNRAKTRDRRSDGAYIEVEIHPVIEPLMRRYRGASRVFNFHRRYAGPGEFNSALNGGLKVVGAAVGIEGLEFYQARHTFATLSRNLMGFSKGDIDEALNHVGSYEIADIYIAKDFSIINRNNFALLDRVFGKIVK